jgi:hypothetical protein
MRISIRVGPFGGTDFSRPLAKRESGREARLGPVRRAPAGWIAPEGGAV